MKTWHFTKNDLDAACNTMLDKTLDGLTREPDIVTCDDCKIMLTAPGGLHHRVTQVIRPQNIECRYYQRTKKLCAPGCLGCLAAPPTPATENQKGLLFTHDDQGAGPVCGFVAFPGTVAKTSTRGEEVSCIDCLRAMSPPVAPVPRHDAGVKDDHAKPRMALLPFGALEWVAKVMTYGARKYAKGNWVTLEDAEERYASAMLRHYTAWQQGEMLDEESGLPHVAHLACDALFICAFVMGTDGTKKKEAE